MSDLYPLLLRPEFHERVWGTRDLSPVYAEYSGQQPIGEAWMTGDNCRVTNGPLAGKSLAELCWQYGRELLGDAVQDSSRFPLLIKFLFPREKLSVQVHPDDESARRMGLPCGKSECWYVLAARPGAQIGLGLKPGTTRAQLEEAIQKNRAEFLLNWIPIKPGEMIYSEAGTVHAIGPGAILVETQQNSDTTFRLYDYGRGRELHVRQGLEATKFETAAGKVKPRGDEEMATLVASPWCVVEKHKVGRLGMSGSNTPQWRSVEILVALNGCGVVEVEGTEPVTFARGEAVVVPASVDRFMVRPQWTVELLAITLPPKGETPVPETTLEVEGGRES